MKNLIVIVLLLLVGAGVIFVGYKLYKRQGRLAYTNSLYVAPTNIPSVTNTKSNDLTLTISSPQDNSTVSSSSIMIVGKTVANAEVSVNDIDTKADGNGNFSATVSLDEGDNTVTVVANDLNGNYTEKELTLTLDSSV